MRVERSRGTTLIELMLALALAGPLLLAAVLLLDTMADHHTRVRGDASRSAHRAAGAALLRRFLYDVEPTMDSAQRFVGEPTIATFTTLCPTPTGGLTRCRARLEIARMRDSAMISLVVDSGPSLIVRRDAWPGAFRYAGDASPAPRWSDRWNAASSPIALAITLPRDTMLFTLGAGGR